MTRLCIVLAVFLVTVIFGMADMEMRSQLIQAVKTDGSWHACFTVNRKQGLLLKERPEIESIAQYGALNYYLKDGYQIEGTETVICGFDEELLEMFPAAELVEGTFPKTPKEAVLNENVKARLGLKAGDKVRVTMPQGEAKEYQITGFTKDTVLEAEHDAFGMCLNTDGFSSLPSGEEKEEDREVLYYVRFRRFCNIQKAIREISTQFGLGEKQVGQNAKVLMLMFQSRDPYMMQFYFVAAVLAVLVVIAGIFMITASMNSNIAGRTEFFGMIRCLGATGKQVIRFVRREAFRWCRTAIPAGLAGGIIVVWILCGMLRYLSPGLFEGLPVFGISYPGTAAGVIVGFITVFLASGSPAKRAARVSPLAAVSGNAGTVKAAKKAAHTRIFKVDTALGIHHASGSKKNFFLVTGSFAFSIILFLSFSTAIDFMHHAITPLRPSAPDISIQPEDNGKRIPAELAGELEKLSGVKHVFGRNYAEFTETESGRDITVISYDEQQFHWLEDSVLEGDAKAAADGKGVISVFRGEDTPEQGSSLNLSAGGREKELLVVGTAEGIYDNIDASADAVICSKEVFYALTGEKDYMVLDIQLEKGTEDSPVQRIREAAEQECGGSITFSDKRPGNQEVRGASYSMSVFLYGFLAVIALIAFFNIINCIAMSVSARMREYGAMRAVGMSTGQLVRMVFSETMTYMIFGAVFGCLTGLPLNRVLFTSLVTSRWGEEWRVPGGELLVIVIIMLAAVLLAVMGPAMRIRRMTVVDTINRE